MRQEFYIAMKKQPTAVRILALLLALCMVPVYALDRAEAQQVQTQTVGQSAPSAAAAEGGRWTETELIQKIRQYLDGDRPALPACPGYHLSKRGKLVLEEGQEFPLTLVDAQGQAVTEDVEWYVFMTTPFEKLFTAADSLVDESPMTYGGETYQKDSLVKIDTVHHTITARNNTGINPYNHKKETFGWVIAVYQGKYGHILSLEVKNKETFDKDRAVEKVTSEVLNATKNMSDPDKVAYVFDYLCDKITYTDSEAGNFSLYEVLVEGRAVCEGYAKAFYHLMDQMGIRAEYKVGDTKSGGAQGESTGISHAWNRVMLEDEWYYLDVTWGDTYPRDYDYLFAERSFMDESRYLNDDGQHIGTKYLGHRLPVPSGDGAADVMDYIGRDWAEQLDTAKKSWHPGKNTFYIYLDAENRSQILDVNNAIVASHASITSQDDPVDIPAESGHGAGLFYKYVIEYDPSPADLKTVNVSYSVTGKKSDTATIQLELSESVDLVKDSIHVKNAAYDKGSFVRAGDTIYTFSVKDFTEPVIEVSLNGYGYQFGDPSPVRVEKAAQTPTASFTGIDLKDGYLMNAEGSWYNTGDGKWIRADSDQIRVTPFQKGYDVHGNHFLSRIMVKRQSPMGFWSDIQTIYISENDAKPGWIKKASDTPLGSEILYTGGTEYRKDGDTQWTLSGDSVKNLKKGRYEFRLTAAENMYASESVFIDIEHFDGKPVNSLTVQMDSWEYGTTAGRPTVRADGMAVDPSDVVFTYTGRLDNPSKDVFPAGNSIPTQPGAYTVTAHYETAAYAVDSDPAAFKILPGGTLKLSGLTGAADKEYDGNTSAVLKGKLTLTGAQRGDDVTIGTIKASAVFASETIGDSKDVVVTVSGNIGGADAWKYNSPAAYPKLKGNILKVSKATVIGPEPGMGLSEKELTDVQARTALKNAVDAHFKNSSAVKFAYRDYQLQVNSVNVHDREVKIVIPYPDGTDQSYIFTVFHYGQDGTVSVVDCSRRAHGLEFVSTTSPFVIAYTAPSAPLDPLPEGNQIQDHTQGASPQTGDSACITFWIALSVLSGAGLVFVKMRKKKNAAS